MLAFVTIHLLVALALPVIARRNTGAAFAVAALPPAAALIWALTQIGPVLGGEEITESVAWAPLIGLEFTFRLDPLSLVMMLLVSGIGALVLLYSPFYFGPASGDARRSAPLLLAFAGAMLGLVLADELITLYIFWELTTICSFLLVGQAGISRESRRSALQALMITTLGGLVMLLGFVILGETSGTYQISELVQNPPTGTPAVFAAMLLLVGAFTKSAQVPFHNWLPTAMVAPTPISAYLHAASMVKAGVFLVARFTPVFAGLTSWWVLTAVFGIATMIMGGWRAMREYDLKKLLAYGTVSQLGFLMVLVGVGTYEAALAGATMLLAHGLFKAALFLTVGIIDHQAGTRDIRELSGMGKRMPVLATLSVLAAASMAGLPPMLGFLGKEAAFSAFLTGSVPGTLIDIGLVVGSVFTVGYSLRFLWGAFAAKSGVAQTEPKPAGLGLLLPVAIPAVVGVVLGITYQASDALMSDYAEMVPEEPTDYHLALWHGLEMPLLLSAIAIAGGVVVHVQSARLIDLRAKLPRGLDAQRGYEVLMALLERTAVGVTGRLQVGSLPTYLGIILITVLLIPGTALLGAGMPDDLRLYDHPLQIPLAGVVIVAAVGLVRSQRRLTAVLMVGVIGYGIGGLFIVDGAPDLALAQFLVETLTMVAFVLVLRRLPAWFSQGDVRRMLRVPKMIIAIAGGVFVSLAAMIFSSAREAPQVASAEFIARAEEGAGATNVVNAILVDFRALDTVGEISVLAVAATGVASLVLASRFERRKHSATSPQLPAVSPAGSGGQQQEEVRE